jgi:ankyrin repeat protein
VNTNHPNSTLEVARLLLQHGADPNAGFLWDRNYLFTALTGVFGEGERGPMHQPAHDSCDQFARLLLESGADPNDDQTLYNRMFTDGVSHLELLFEFGLGQGANGVWYKRLGGRLNSPAEMLQQQLAWAVKYDQRARLHLLIKHGVDLNQPDRRFKRAPYEIALMSGNLEVAEILLKHGARKTSLSSLDAFKAACLNADGDKARSLLAEDPTLLAQLGSERAELLNLAAESDKREAIRLMASLGFDLNERKRTCAIHVAAAGGHIEMVKLLIELGADLSVRDEEFSGTAMGWAEYSGQTAVIDFLKSVL